MARHHVERILPYQPDQLFKLVGDVTAYPEFIPWITSMRTWNEARDGEGVDRLDAEASVGFSFLTERFSTRVLRDANEPAVHVSLLDGPFKRLANEWRFREHPVGTRLVFDIDFEFKSKVLDLMLQANFDRAVAKLIGCFESRAMALYTPLRSSPKPPPAASAGV